MKKISFIVHPLCVNWFYFICNFSNFFKNLWQRLCNSHCNFLVLAGLIALFEYQLQISELDELEQIQYVNHQAESGLASLLDKMPVGVIKINEESNEVEWFNPYAELIFQQMMGTLMLNL